MTPEDFVSLAGTLAEQGWATQPDFLPPVAIRALAAELQAYWGEGDFRHAGVGVGANLKVRPEIRTDRVHWLSETAQTEAERPYFAALESLRLAINQELYLGLFGFEGHMTVYPPGSFYARHLDQFKGVAHRKVSAILYLNDAWQVADGGQLRLYLQAGDSEGTGPSIDILPNGGTLALFMSDRFYHEVLPTERERMSITGWFKTRG